MTDVSLHFLHRDPDRVSSICNVRVRGRVRLRVRYIIEEAAGSAGNL